MAKIPGYRMVAPECCGTCEHNVGRSEVYECALSPTGRTGGWGDMLCEDVDVLGLCPKYVRRNTSPPSIRSDD